MLLAGRFLEQDISVYKQTMDINYFGTLNVVKAAVPGMVERRAGQVVIVASALAVCGTSVSSQPSCMTEIITRYTIQLLDGPVPCRCKVASHCPGKDGPSHGDHKMNPTVDGRVYGLHLLRSHKVGSTRLGRLLTE